MILVSHFREERTKVNEGQMNSETCKSQNSKPDKAAWLQSPHRLQALHFPILLLYSHGREDFFSH